MMLSSSHDFPKAAISGQLIRLPISVIIPTYQRVDNLERCLRALQSQTEPAAEVLVIVRNTDEDTQSFLNSFDAGPLPVRIVSVEVPGQVAALNKGLKDSTGEIIAIVDDDTAPYSDWLSKIQSLFLQDGRVGGVGGRDWVIVEGKRDERTARTVGKLQWFGRTIGNHRWGAGKSREVDILKGANMSYRRSAVRSLTFDERLKGTGVQYHNDMAFSLAVKQAGWKLIYDPSVSVDHFEAPRADKDQRFSVVFQSDAQYNAVYNETAVLLQYLPAPRRVAFLLWAFLIGTHVEPGLIQLLRLLVQGREQVVPRFVATMSGRVSGINSFIHGVKI